MDSYKNWDLRIDERTAILSLDRQHAADTLDTETLEELAVISETIHARKDIWSVVLRSDGRHFSTGFNPELIRSKIEEPEAAIRDMVADHQRCLNSFENIGKPVVAAIRGFCIGGGVLLACCCDFRIASERSIFSLPEVRLGLPILWGTHRIVRVLGPANAKRMIMLGERFRARQALELGLVHSVVNDEDLEKAVDGYLKMLHNAPPVTQAMAKEIVERSMDTEGTRTEELELEALATLAGSHDVAEAISSYFAGELPRYQGDK